MLGSSFRRWRRRNPRRRARLNHASLRRTRIEEDIKRYVGYIECSSEHASDTFESGYWEGGLT